MTVHQQNCLLSFLGYEGDDAIVRFQQDHGLEADGIFGPLTKSKILQVICQDDGWSGIRHFTRGEFACKCGSYCDGYPAEMDRTLVQTADRLRKHFGAPVLVSSGLRCSRHNTAVGGVSNSRHLSGKAMDFCVAGKTAAAVLEFVQQQPQIRYAYSIDGNYVHMDVN